MSAPTVTCTIDRLSYGPAGVARIDGKVVFVPGTAPGDEVVITIDEEKKTYATGRVVEVRTPSPHRRQPPCPYVARCGGCPWQHIEYQEQLRAKELLVREQLRRIGGLDDIPLLPILPSPTEWRYRQRIRLHVGPGRSVGFLAPRSHDIVAIDSCLVAWERMPSHLRLVRDWIGSLRTVVSQVELAVEDFTAPPEEQRVIVFGQARGPFYQEDEEACVRLLEAARTLIAGVRLQGKTWRRAWGKTSRTFLGEGDTLTVNDSAFTQVNPAANHLLVEATLRLSGVRGDDTVIELYCGSGNLSVAFARAANKLIGIEHDEKAIANARANVTRADVTNARFLHAPAAVGVRELLNDGVRGDVIVLDPPRAGAADIVDDLPRFGARVITYVSCDPATLARDLRRLHQQRYQLQAVQPIDMFPQTYHVEVIAVSVLTC